MKHTSDKERFKIASRLVVKHYLREVRLSWKRSLPGFLLPAIGTIFIAFIPPLAVAAAVKQGTEQGFSNFGDFVPFIAIFAGSWILGETLWRIGLHLIVNVETNAVANLYKQGLSELLRRDLDFFHDNFAGSLTKKTIGYASRFVDIADTMMFNVASRLLPIVFASIVLAFYSPWLALCLIGWLAATIIIVTPLIRKRRKLVIEREIASNVVSGHIADIYGNIDAVRAHASEPIEQQRSQIFVKDLTLKMKRSWDFQNLRIDTIISPIYVAANVSGLLLSLYLAQNGTIEFTSIIVVFAYFTLVTSFFWEFNSVYRRLESAISDAAQFTELLLTEPTIHDPETSHVPKNVKGLIEFNDVTFQYENNTKPLFDHFSFTVEPGQKIGLIGRSGGGKTSITKLLLRFVDITSGSIAIDGHDITGMSQHDLRNLIAYVPQDPVMFHRSITDNIAYGRPNAAKEMIITAAKKAHAHEFISQLPNGYDTLVGERGIKLSGGQRQRVAIARAILKDSPILLLDEATSALDSESEQLIQDALHELMKHRTTIVIAHRLSTIQDMDKIIVLEKGSIAEQGTHSELLNNDGLYATLWSHQTGGFIED